MISIMRASRLPGLARPSTLFVGRTRELSLLDELFSAGERLVTLVGPPGIGKTRLAMEWLHRKAQVRRWSPAWVCNVAGAKDTLGICTAVAELLGMRLAAADQATLAVERVGRALSARRAPLLLLDNFEHLADCAEETLARWLGLAPKLRLLVTSRRLLRIDRERVVEIEPLDVAASTSRSGDPPAAVLLFFDRAKRVRLDYAGNAPDLSTALRIVRCVEGNPLAIELTAARINAVDAETLLARLESGLDVLTTTPLRTARHASMRTAIASSWELLDRAEQSALTTLSVFDGGVTLAMAHAVLGQTVEGRAPLTLVQALRDASLVRVQRATDPKAADRLVVYGPVKEFAAETLPQVVGQARRALVGELLRALEPVVENVEKPGNWERLRDELPNLLAAVDHVRASRGAGDDKLELARLVLVLDSTLASRGPLTLHTALLDEVSDADVTSDYIRVRLLHARGDIARRLHRLSDAHALLDLALATSERLGNPRIRGRILRSLGAVLVERSRYDEAHDTLVLALDELRTAGDAAGEARTLLVLGGLEVHLQRFGPAFDHLAVALHMQRVLGDAMGESDTLAWLGTVELERDRLTSARDHLEQALALNRRLGRHWASAFVSGALGLIDHLDGNLDSAVEHYERARHDARQAGDRRLEGIQIGYIGLATLGRGLLDQARGLLRVGIAIMREVGDLRHATLFLAHAAAASAIVGGAEEAVAEIADADATLAACREPQITAVVAAMHGVVDVALARRADTLGDAQRAATLRGTALRRLETGDEGEPRLAAGSADVRLAFRLLRDVITRDEVEPSHTTWLVHESGAWFQAPGSLKIECLPHRAVTAILAELARRRLRDPGRAISRAQLVEAAWPGERILDSAARNRVNVALSTLRGLGLRTLLRTTRDGHMLDPEVPLRLIANDET